LCFNGFRSAFAQFKRIQVPHDEITASLPKAAKRLVQAWTSRTLLLPETASLPEKIKELQQLQLGWNQVTKHDDLELAKLIDANTDDDCKVCDALLCYS